VLCNDLTNLHGLCRGGVLSQRARGPCRLHLVWRSLAVASPELFSFVQPVVGVGVSALGQGLVRGKEVARGEMWTPDHGRGLEVDDKTNDQLPIKYGSTAGEPPAWKRPGSGFGFH
jgi:hypothetical protein